MKRLPSPVQFSGIFLLFLLGLAFRGLALPAVSADMVGYIRWYDFLIAHGVRGVGINFSIYTPPYLYLLWLMTLTSNSLPAVIAIKLISILADIANAGLIYLLVRIKYPTGSRPLLAGILLWALPTVMINSSLWGEVDALYTLFLLACIYFLLTEKPLWAMSAFGAAFAFKAQAIFILPLLAILFFERRIAWQSILLVPLIYIILCVPATLLGRSWLDVLSIYSLQASTFQSLSKNAPNLYIFMSAIPYNLGTIVGLILAVLIVGYWTWLNVRAKIDINHNTLILIEFGLRGTSSIYVTQNARPLFLSCGYYFACRRFLYSRIVVRADFISDHFHTGIYGLSLQRAASIDSSCSSFEHGNHLLPGLETSPIIGANIYSANSNSKIVDVISSWHDHRFRFTPHSIYL